MRILLRFVPVPAVLSYSFRHVEVSSRQYHLYNQAKKESQPSQPHTLLSKLLGVNHTVSKQIVKDHPMFRQSDQTDMKKCAAVLQKAGYSSEYVKKHLPLLLLPPFFLKNSLYLCQEFACYNENIGPAVIDFYEFLNLNIYLLRGHKIIPSDINILDSFLYFMKIPKSECDIQIDESDTVREVYWKFFNFYLQREFQTENHILKQMKKEDYCVSFRLLRKNLHLLRNTFGFTNEQFMEMPFLLRTDAENTISLLQSARGVDMKEVIVAHPRLLTVPSQNIQALNDFLMKNEINFTLLLKEPEILLMDINLLLYRLAKFAFSPSLSVFKNHPRLVDLIKNGGMVGERMLILKRLNMHCFDVNLLTCPRAIFLKHIVEGIDRGVVKDTCLVISLKLQRPYDDVRRELTKNGGVEYVPVVRVRDNMEYLLRLGFSKDNIYESVQILLYPKAVIETKINDVIMNSMVVNDPIQFQVLKKKYFLPFALYNIEKEFSFTEFGIWTKDERTNSGHSVFDNKLLTAS